MVIGLGVSEIVDPEIPEANDETADEGNSVSTWGRGYTSITFLMFLLHPKWLHHKWKEKKSNG